MYELVFGYTPFRGNKRDQTFENILKRKLEFPAKPEISPALQVRTTTVSQQLTVSGTGKYHNRASTPLNAVTYNLHGFAKQ